MSEGQQQEMPSGVLIAFRLCDLVGRIFFYALIGWVALLTRDVLVAAVGHRTDISISLVAEALLSRGNDYGIPWIVTGAFFLWGYLERNFRHKKTEQLQARIVELEKIVDPDRTSSELLPSGKTNPRDRL